MKLGCLFSILFAFAGLIIFAIIAPIIFHGADMRALGQLAALPVIMILGPIGFVVGYRLQKRRTARSSEAVGELTGEHDSSG